MHTQENIPYELVVNVCRAHASGLTKDDNEHVKTGRQVTIIIIALKGTDITSGLQLGRAEVLRGLRNFLSTDKPEHHSIDRLKERGVEKGSGRHSTLQGRERSVFNQTNIGTVSRATLGRLLRGRAGARMGPFRALRCHLELKLKLKLHSSRFFLQSPHCAANRLQHVRSSALAQSRAKSHTTNRALITCNMS